MPTVKAEFVALRNPRLAALATSATPAWLWSADASEMLWANAVGAAIFGAANAGACAGRRFDPKDPSAAQIGRLAATLPGGGQERLERLRGFGAGFGRALTCVCSRITLGDDTPAILVAATEPAGPVLSLGERVRRLFAGGEEMRAAFAPDGTLVYADDATRTQLGDATSLPALGLERLAATALESGSAHGTAPCGEAGADVAIQALGADSSRVLLLTLTPPRPPEAGAERGAPGEVEPATVAAVPQAPPPAQANAPEPPTERRHPLRFVWQMDADGRFVVGSDEFIALVGPRIMATFGRLWSEIAAELNLDPANQVARAVATHETWSGITIQWPVDESSEHLPVELSGLPVFDRDRTFRGYRGFGVCRDIDRINQLARARRERPLGFMPAPEPPSDAAGPVPPSPPPSPPPQGAAAVEAAPRAERAALSVAPAAANVVPFRVAPTAEPKAPSLSPVERTAFRELAQELTARLRGPQSAPATAENLAAGVPAEQQPQAEASVEAVEAAAAPAAAEAAPHAGPEPAEQGAAPAPPPAPSLLEEAEERGRTAERALGAAENEIRELKATLDVAADGVVVLDRDGRVVRANGGAAALFAKAAAELEGRALRELLAPSSEAAARDYFDRVAQSTVAQTTVAQATATPHDAIEVEAPGRDGAPLPLAMSIAGIGGERFCAVFRDATQARKTEEELRAARREVQKTTAGKAEFLAKVSHEIRTPLNAITGFAEVIVAERLGAIGNERYREYLKDIHAAGTHLVSLLNDLLDLSKIETGRLDLSFANISLNALTQQCVAIMQPQANRARIIIRTSLTPGLPQIVADERSVRQIVLNLVANSIRFTGPGGQVIVSTAFSDAGEVVLRVRDTGVGMSEKDVEAALEPFRQTATSGSWGSGGTGLGLPLTKALAEANRADFSIKSAPNAGTLVEVAFPPNRVAAG